MKGQKNRKPQSSNLKTTVDSDKFNTGTENATHEKKIGWMGLLTGVSCTQIKICEHVSIFSSLKVTKNEYSYSDSNVLPKTWYIYTAVPAGKSIVFICKIQQLTI